MPGYKHLLAVLAAILFATSAVTDCVFVNNNSNPNTVTAFQANLDGSLSPIAGSPFATGAVGGPLGISYLVQPRALALEIPTVGTASLILLTLTVLLSGMLVLRRRACTRTT